MGARADILPVLAVSSTDYRGLLHLKQELARLSMVREKMGGSEGVAGQMSGQGSGQNQEWDLMDGNDEDDDGIGGVSLHEEMVRRNLRPPTSTSSKATSSTSTSNNNYNIINNNNNNNNFRASYNPENSSSVKEVSKRISDKAKLTYVESNSYPKSSNNTNKTTPHTNNNRPSLTMKQDDKGVGNKGVMIGGKGGSGSGSRSRNGVGIGKAKAVGKVRERWSEEAKELQRRVREKSERAGECERADHL